MECVDITSETLRYGVKVSSREAIWDIRLSMAIVTYEIITLGLTDDKLTYIQTMQMFCLCLAHTNTMAHITMPLASDLAPPDPYDQEDPCGSETHEL